METNQIIIKRINDVDFEETINLIIEVMHDFGQLTENLKENEEARLYFKLVTYSDFKNNELELYGAFYNNELIGILGNEKNYLNYFFVRKKYQKQKVGLLLMKNYLARMKQEKFEIIYVDASNYAHEIYKKLGFVDAYEQEIDKKEYEMIYRMENYNGI